MRVDAWPRLFPRPLKRQPPTAPMSTAKVSLSVTQFYTLSWQGEDGLKGRCCEIAAPAIVDDGGGLVSIDPNDPNTLKVNGVVDIEFDILPAGEYFPYSIVFFSGNGQFGTPPQGDDPNGTITFQDPRPGDSSITITDTMARRNQPSAPARWEFWILLKNSMGLGGAIDPGIENSAED